MTLPVFGNALTVQQIATEFSQGSVMGLNHYYAGGGFVPSGTNGYPNGGGATAIPASGQISFNNFYGASRGTITTFNGFNAIAVTGGATLGVQMKAVCCNNSGLWVALGRAVVASRINSSISTNGTTWSLPAAVSTLANVTVNAVTSNNAGLFCAVGSVLSIASAAYSTNGTTWTAFAQMGGVSTYYVNMQVIACNADGLFVSVGGDGAYIPYFSTSTDGMTFTAPALVNANAYMFTQGIAVSPSGLFVLIANDLNSYFRCSISTDGSTWSTWSLFNGFTLVLYGGRPVIAYAGGKYVVVMSAGLSGFGYCTSSTDGVTWATPTLMTGAGIVFYPNAMSVNRAGVFVAIGTNVSNQPVWTSSTNGTTWTTPVMMTGTGVVANSVLAIASNPAGVFNYVGYKASPYLPVVASSN